MRVNRLKLVDFRNHAETDITFGKLTCVRGGNTDGKSSIKSAIEFTLTGRCEGTDEKGTGAADLIRQGSDKAGILMRLQANKEVMLRCTLTEKSGRSLTIKDENDPSYGGEAVKEFLDSHKDLLSCLLDGRYFMGLKPAEQKTLLAGIILPDRYEWPESIKEKLSSVNLSAQINWDQAPFEVIEQAYKLATDKRRDLNRDLENLIVPHPLALPEGVISAIALRSTLSDKRSYLSQLEDARYQKQKARSKVEADIRALEVRTESLEAKLRTENQALNLAEKSVLGGKSLKDVQKTAGNAKKLAEIEAKRKAIREQVAGVTAILAQFDALDGKTCCPTCNRDVTDEWLITAMQPHVDRKNALAIEERDLLTAQSELGDVAAAQRSLDEHERGTSNAQRSKGIIGETNSLLQTAQDELRTLRDQLSNLPKPEEQEDEGPSLREEVKKLEGQLEQVAVSESRDTQIKQSKERQQKLTKAIDTLETLVNAKTGYFAKNGIKAELLKEHIGGFTSAMNEVLDNWGYACGFEIEPYGFLVTNLTRNTTLRLGLLSGSERLRFSVAFQVALAQVSGIRMVIVDEADLLDAEGRGWLYPMLISADLDQAIAIGTDEREDVPEIEGVVFYAMQDGKAVQLQPVGV